MLRAVLFGAMLSATARPPVRRLKGLAMKSPLLFALLLTLTGCQNQSELKITPNKESQDASKREEIKAEVKAKIDSGELSEPAKSP